MDEGGTTKAFLFGAFRLDWRAGTLFRRDERGAAIPVAIGSRGFAVLDMLVAHHGELVSKNEIMRAVWSERVVEDNNLTVQIAALRRVLDQGRAGGSCIQTIPGRGYRFVAPVMRVDGNAHSTPQIISDDGGRSRRLSIVVLPFVNLSDDREQQYFADGITEDLTTDLSRISGSFVIARNTAFTYKDKAIDAKQIGRELGVRYVLEGSVRRSEDRVRVNAQLIDAENGAHLWAERFNRKASDLLEIQDDITRRIAFELTAELVEAESKRSIRERPNNLDSVDLAMQARALVNKPPSPEQNAQIRQLYEKALAIDPQNVDALIGLAASYLAAIHDLHVSEDHEWKRRATDAVNSALAIKPRDARAFLAKSRVLAYSNERDYRGELDEATAAAETAITLDPNLAGAYGWLGRLYAKAGHPERTAASVEQAMRLSPRDPNMAGWLFQIGMAQLQMARYDEAIATFRKSLVANPNLPISRENLSAAYLGAGCEAEARNVLAGARSQAATRMPDQLDEQLLIMRVQLALLQRGFWPYSVCGRYLRVMVEALRAFQRKENLPETGIVNEGTLARLGVAKASV